MTPRLAKWFIWTSFTLGCIATLANFLTGAGFMPRLGMQICGLIAGICTAFSWHFARKAPSNSPLIQSRPAPETGLKENDNARPPT